MSSTAEVGYSVDTEVLVEIFERETPKCQSKHTWPNNPPESCTREVAYILHACNGTINVCQHTYDAWVEFVAKGCRCSDHNGLQGDHKMVPA